MKVEVIMPQMGESIVEGTVVSWLKKPGDAVKRDEDIFTISTDKVDADIPSPAEGILQEVLVEVGDTVEVGSVVAYIETDASAAAGKTDDKGQGKAKGDGKPKGDSTKAAKSEEKPASSKKGAAVEDAGDKAPRNAADRDAAPEKAAKAAPVDQRDDDDDDDGDADEARDGSDVDELRRTRSTPLVRKIAREHGITDLSKVPGTGVSGRVTKNDILAYVASRAEEAAKPARAAAPAAPRSAAPAQAEAPAPVRAPKVHVWDDDHVEALSRMRRSIAQHMVMSRAVSAHAQSVWDCDWTRAMKAYKAMKPKFAERGVRLTVTALLVEAAVHALRAVPIVNSSTDGENVIRRNRINVGVAVAIPDGLIVPVVKHADELSLQGIARAVNDLAERSREKRLKPDDVEGGTFTISNPGVFGSRFGIPIINQPQVGILGVGAVKKRVVVGEDDSIRVASMNTMCLSFDHRVVDGAQADEFMGAFVGFIEKYEAEG
jgi:pyruvate dehydrogenase E2 component (dihydrolipoamide acetyltransferase)